MAHLPACARRAGYILNNPRVAELVKAPEEGPFSGAVVPVSPTLHPLQDDFWPTFWKLYTLAKHSDAGNILKPPIS